MKESPSSTTMPKMNYKAAIITTKHNTICNETTDASQQSREEYLKMIEDAEFQKRARGLAKSLPAISGALP